MDIFVPMCQQVQLAHTTLQSVHRDSNCACATLAQNFIEMTLGTLLIDTIVGLAFCPVGGIFFLYSMRTESIASLYARINPLACTCNKAPYQYVLNLMLEARKMSPQPSTCYEAHENHFHKVSFTGSFNAHNTHTENCVASNGNYFEGYNMKTQ
jgi:hypothetical protein